MAAYFERTTAPINTSVDVSTTPSWSGYSFNLSDSSPPVSNQTQAKCHESDAFYFVFNALVIGSLCVFGMLGNSLSILILQRDPNNKVAIYLLQALAVADNLLLFVSFIALSLWKGVMPYAMKDKNQLFNSIAYIHLLVNPLGAMAQTATIWTTVLLALNRFFAVCLPFRAPFLCTLKRAKIQVVGVMVFAVCFNLPRCFQLSLKTTVQHRFDDTSGLWENTTSVKVEDTSIGDKTTFGIVYTNALYSVLVLILPMLLIIVLNCRLIQELRYSRRRRSRRAPVPGMANPSDENISVIMIVIIVVFIICQTPDRILQILHVSVFGAVECSLSQERLMCLSNLLVIINSSTNFVIYYVFRRSFRKIFKQRMCSLRRGGTSSGSAPHSEPSEAELCTSATKLPMLTLENGEQNGHGPDST